MSGADHYGRNVFINCPFDPPYLSLLRPLLFAIVRLGFHPRIALERSDSGEARIDKICSLIRESRYSIHDLSRIRASEKEELFRLNMPFELGVDYGCRRFGDGAFGEKRCLILAGDGYEYRAALSDISGLDIKSHQQQPARVVRAVRDWFVENAGVKRAESPTRIWYSFNVFTSDFYDARKREGFSGEDLDMMPVPEYIGFIREWLEK